MNKKVIFVHGYTASSKADWYPSISRELDKLGVDYSIPDFPGGEYPHSKEWLEFLDSEIKATDQPIILVGHSLGTRAILLYLDKFQKEVDSIILVAPPDNDVKRGGGVRRADGKLADFWEYEIDLKKLRELANTFIVVHSKDDSVVTYQDGVNIASALGAKLITLEGRDHMSEPENYTYVLEILRSVL